jgi:hypothetical protein
MTNIALIQQRARAITDLARVNRSLENLAMLEQTAARENQQLPEALKAEIVRARETCSQAKGLVEAFLAATRKHVPIV